ncbi:MAG TPA: PTS sugar transporter subunit IIB [Tetragenococcus sp.]|nr:PTS sugar transporter subunit IIB [Tetragenococcus sp.]
MSKKTIMLVCAAGMSTNMLVSRMQRAAEHLGLDIDVIAAPAVEAADLIKEKKIDILLLGPQVRYLKSDFEKCLAESKVPVDIVNMKDYGMVDGESILRGALNLL